MLQTLLVILTLVNMTDSSSLKPQGIPTDFSITVDRNFTGEAGLCITVNCHFTAPESIMTEPLNKTWFKGDPQNPTAELPCFHTDIAYNSQCSFELRNLVQGESDGEYRFKLQWGQNKTYIFPETVNITVKGLSQKPELYIPALIVGQQANLTCTAPGACERPLTRVIWTGINTTLEKVFGVVGHEHFSTLFLNPELRHHNTKLTCTVIFNGNIRTETSAILKIRYAPQILKSSHCGLWAGELTCVCVSNGFPLPRINWPLSSVASDFNITAPRHKHKLRISVLSISDLSHLNSTIKCTSVNKMGLAQMEIQVQRFGEIYKVSGNLSTLWIFCMFSVAVNIIFCTAFSVLYLRRRREHARHVYMTTMKRKESLYETINKCSERC